MRTESDKTKENIEKFEERLKEYFIRMKKEKFYSDETDIEDARHRIEEVKQDVSKLEEELDNYVYFAKMFNYPDKVGNINK